MTCTNDDIVFGIRRDCELLIGALYNAERALLADKWTTPAKRTCARWLRVALDHAREVSTVVVIDYTATEPPTPLHMREIIDGAVDDVQALFIRTYEPGYAPCDMDARAWAGTVAGMLLGLADFTGHTVLPDEWLETPSTIIA